MAKHERAGSNLGMSGTNIVNVSYPGYDPGPEWKVVGTGDYTGDGYSDILWQSKSGQIAIWDMTGAMWSTRRMAIRGRVGAPFKRDHRADGAIARTHRTRPSIAARDGRNACSRTRPCENMIFDAGVAR
jgi:hypothetical protein